MAREIVDVAGGGTIEASWGNNVRNRAIMRYASSSARNSAVPSPGEGEVCYLEDTNILTMYNGSAWETVLLEGDVYSEAEVDALFTAKAQGVKVTRSTATTALNATESDFPFNLELYDNWDGWASTPEPGHIDIDETGYYIATFLIQYGAHATGVRQVAIYRNTSMVAMTRINAVTGGDSTPVQVVYAGILAAGDYLQFKYYQDSGTNPAIGSGQNNCEASVHKIS